MCEHNRTLSIQAHCRDSFNARLKVEGKVLHDFDGYVPKGLGLGSSSDDVEITYCLDCGLILNEAWPRPTPWE